MTNITLDELINNVTEWATIRDIYKESNEQKQVEKAASEVVEFVFAETEDEEKDAIGDITVCLINAAYFKGGLELFSFEFQDPMLAQPNIRLVNNYILSRKYELAIALLNQLAKLRSYNIEECYGMAWDAIKNRLGMMIDGKYVKWEDLTPQQQIILKARLKVD